MLAAAHDHMSAGALAADAIAFSSPWRRAQFSTIRDEFIDQWKPLGGIESSLIDCSPKD
jgi:hypothetical protein